MTKSVPIAIALFLALTAVRAEAPPVRSDSGLDCPFCLAVEIDRLAALLADGVLREVLCRLASERYTPASLSAALGVPQGQVLRRLDTLRGWGLVRMVRRDSATTVVEPLPGAGARTLARWGVKYCPAGEACGRPMARAGNDTRARKADRRGAASRGSGGKPAMTPGYWSRAVAQLHRADPILADIIAGYPRQSLVGRGDPFGTLARSIVGQQLSVKAAASIWQKLTAGLGGISPGAFASAPVNRLLAAGLSRQKVRYLQDLGSDFRSGRLNAAAWREADDETVIAQLVQIKGVGRWTAEMYLIFHLMRPDVLPLADIGLRKAVARHYNHGVTLTDAEIETIAKPWQPWRSVATWYLWRSLDPEPVAY